MKDIKMHSLIDQEKQHLAKRYHKDNLVVHIMSYAVAGVFILLLLYFNISKNFVIILNSWTSARFFLVLVYFAALFLVYTLLTFAFAYLDSYKIEHKYGFSTQNFQAWFMDFIKSFLVTFVLGVIVFEVIYSITLISVDLWWFWISIIMIFFSVILSNLFPVLILPLFYKTSPIENEALKKKIAELCSQAKINITGVFSINLSSKTTKANAAVVGLGNTKRILLGDTLLGRYTEDEIITTLSHEITHDRGHHIWWLVLGQSVIILIMFYLLSRLYLPFYSFAGFSKISDVAAFPLFALIFMVLSFIFNPLGSIISRFYERKADKGALELTKNPDALISLMAKLCNESLAIAYPNPSIEWYKYTHPSVGKRIRFAEQWKSAHT